MEDQKKVLFADENPRSLLKTQHRKVYSICRLFADNYKQHQSLVSNILAVASRCLRIGRNTAERKTIYLRACINMAVLHSLSQGLKNSRSGASHSLAPLDQTIRFKSPDYQKSILGFRNATNGLSDFEKILLFLNFEKVAPEDITSITGLTPVPVQAHYPTQAVGQRFIPHIKEKIIWS